VRAAFGWRLAAAGPNDGSSTDEAEERHVTAGVRVLLALTALVVTFVDPSEPSRFVSLTYIVLVLYFGYAVVLYVAARRDAVLSRPLHGLLPLIDVATCAALIALSGGSNSIYFILFVFGILISSFHGGFAYGVAVTSLAAIFFVVVGYTSRPSGADFDLNRFLLRAGSLPLLGYLIAYRGGYELHLRRRLGLLREMLAVSNPRFGPNRMLARALARLRAFYDADLAAAVLPQASGDGYRLHTSTRGTAGTASEPEPLPEGFARALLAFGPDEIVCYRPDRRRRPLVVVKAKVRARETPADARPYEDVAGLLGTRAFMTVPLPTRGASSGRLYVCARKPRFDARDSEFLSQVAEQLMSSLAHVELVERMATRAAEDERQRIALDIHDRIIQPHIGLQIGLASVEQLVSNETGAATLPVVRDRLRALGDLTMQGIADLRGYVQGLRDGLSPTRNLPDSVRRFAARFHEATGVQVLVDVPDDLSMDDRLAAEIFSMVSEAVSNVRRHTAAPGAHVSIRKTADRIVLRVENAPDSDHAAAGFVPRSIAQRAAAINGTATVEFGDGRNTAVVVEIPL
jgi:signal transduction histidine kinase